jgi:hypothetical protein
MQGVLALSPYEIGGKPNAREAGGCFARAKYPPVSLREPSPLFPQGGQSNTSPGRGMGEPSQNVLNGQSQESEMTNVRSSA